MKERDWAKIVLITLFGCLIFGCIEHPSSSASVSSVMGTPNTKANLNTSPNGITKANLNTSPNGITKANLNTSPNGIGSCYDSGGMLGYYIVGVPVLLTINYLDSSNTPLSGSFEVSSKTDSVSLDGSSSSFSKQINGHFEGVVKFYGLGGSVSNLTVRFDSSDYPPDDVAINVPTCTQMPPNDLFNVGFSENNLVERKAFN